MIKIICVGKIKEKYLLDAIKEYQKRLSKYTKLEIIEVDDYSFNSISNEAEIIIKHIKDKEIIISLSSEGKEISSIGFSQLINDSLIKGNVTFIIGGSDGLSEKIKSTSNHIISFSKLTFPHQLFRVILLEQIYRSYKIINNETYHK